MAQRLTDLSAFYSNMDPRPNFGGSLIASPGIDDCRGTSESNFLDSRAAVLFFYSTLRLFYIS